MDAVFQLAIRNSAIVALGTLLFSIPVATLLSILLTKFPVIGRRSAWMLAISMMVLPLYVHAGAWSAGFGDLGWWTLSQTKAAGAPLQGLTAIIWIEGLAAVPWVMIFLSLGLNHIPRDIEDLARLEGGLGHVARSVWLPRLLPWIGVSAVWVSLWSTGEMVVTNLFRVPTLAEQVYLDAVAGEYKVSWIIMVACPALSLTVGLTVWVATKAIGQGTPIRDWALAVPLEFRDMSLRNSRYYKVVASAVVWIILMISTGLPILNLVMKAGWVPKQVDGQVTREIHISRIVQTIAESPAEFQTEFAWSAQLAIYSATLWTAAATLMVLGCYRFPRLLSLAIGWVLLLASIPGPVVGILIIRMLNRPGQTWLADLYYDTLTAPIVAVGTRCLPIAFVLLWPAIFSVPKSVIEAARMDGLSSWTIFWRVILPIRWGAFVGTWLLSAAVAAADLSCSILVLPPQVYTVAIRTFEILHYGVRYQEAGICLLVIFASVLCSAAVLTISRLSKLRN